MNNEVGLKDKNGVAIQVGDILIFTHKDIEGYGFDSFTQLGEVRRGWFSEGLSGAKCFGYAIDGYSWSNFKDDKTVIERENSFLDDFFLMENGNLNAEIIGNSQDNNVIELVEKYKTFNY